MKTNLIKMFYGTTFALMMVLLFASLASPGEYQFRLFASLTALAISALVLIKFKEKIAKCDEEEKKCQVLKTDLKNMKGGIIIFLFLTLYFFISYHTQL